MSNTFTSSRDIIIRTEKWSEALKFYESVLALPITKRNETIVGFETGAFCLYVERGKEHGPVFDFLVPDINEAKRQLLASGCSVIEEDPEIPRCYIKDPYGVVFNIEQSFGEKSADAV
jgi:predicted enzyme related to lactoylglutathione lyase